MKYPTLIIEMPTKRMKIRHGHRNETHIKIEPSSIEFPQWKLALVIGIELPVPSIPIQLVPLTGIGKLLDALYSQSIRHRP